MSMLDSKFEKLLDVFATQFPLEDISKKEDFVNVSMAILAKKAHETIKVAGKYSITVMVHEIKNSLLDDLDEGNIERLVA